MWPQPRWEMWAHNWRQPFGLDPQGGREFGSPLAETAGEAVDGEAMSLFAGAWGGGAERVWCGARVISLE